MEELIKYLKKHIKLCDELGNMEVPKLILQYVLKKAEAEQLRIGGVSKRFIVMYEDGDYYGSFSPLGIWETYEGAEIAEKKWIKENPTKQACIEEVDYNAC